MCIRDRDASSANRVLFVGSMMCAFYQLAYCVQLGDQALHALVDQVAIAVVAWVGYVVKSKLQQIPVVDVLHVAKTFLIMDAADCVAMGTQYFPFSTKLVS